MADNLYECMFLLDSGKFAADHEGMSQTVLEILEKAGGTVVAHRPWQDGKLAYEIEGHRKAVHYLVYFRMEGDGLTAVTRACKLNDSILRHLVIRQPKTLFDAMVAALEGKDPSAEQSEKTAASSTTKSDAKPADAKPADATSADATSADTEPADAADGAEAVAESS